MELRNKSSIDLNNVTDDDALGEYDNDDYEYDNEDVYDNDDYKYDNNDDDDAVPKVFMTTTIITMMVIMSQRCAR